MYTDIVCDFFYNYSNIIYRRLNWGVNLMRISSVIINNYKSIGTQKNTLLLEDDVTALIGKNDSGKSNVLEILGGISFSHYILDEFYKYNNGSSEEKLSLTVELKFTKKEISLLKEFKNLNEDYTYFYFFKDKEIEFKGGFSRLFSEDIELIKSCKSFPEISRTFLPLALSILIPLIPIMGKLNFKSELFSVPSEKIILLFISKAAPFVVS